jgi:hypothetical protein
MSICCGAYLVVAVILQVPPIVEGALRTGSHGLCDAAPQRRLLFGSVTDGLDTHQRRAVGEAEVTWGVRPARLAQWANLTAGARAEALRRCDFAAFALVMLIAARTIADARILLAPLCDCPPWSFT